MLNPLNRLVFPWFSELRLSFERWLFQDAIDQGRFSRTGNPVTAMNFPRGKRTVMSCKLFSLAPVISIERPFPERRSVGTGILRLPDKYWPVMDLLLRATCFGVPAATIFPKDTGTWADVDQVVCLSWYLHHVRRQSRYCLNRASSETGNQAVIVPLMEADRRLIQDVKDTREVGTDLGCQGMRWLSPPDKVPADRDRVK